jgi:chromosomal replication initiation ATPase DnaA
MISDQIGPLCLFLYGGSGSGKSYQLRQINSGLTQKGYHILHCSAQDLVNHIIEAIKGHHIEDLRLWALRYDVLLIDDIWVLEGKSRTAEFVLAVLSFVVDAGKMVVVATDLDPAHVLSWLKHSAKLSEHCRVVPVSHQLHIFDTISI